MGSARPRTGASDSLARAEWQGRVSRNKLGGEIDKTDQGRTMTPEKLSAFVRRKPFEPVRLTLESGETYEIHHPETIVISRIGCALADEARNDFVVFDAERVTSVRYLRESRVSRGGRR